MSEEIITKITDIVIQQTIGQKIPTVIFLSDIDKGSLVKNIIWSIKQNLNMKMMKNQK